MLFTRIRSFVGNYFRRQSKSAKETDDSEKSIKTKVIYATKPIVRLVYPYTDDTLTLITWVSEHSSGKVNMDVVSDDIVENNFTSFIATQTLHIDFEDEADALICKIKYPPRN